jgi:hypothetical protein
MTGSDLSCKKETRREDVRAAPLYGLDFVEVSASQTTLTVFFLGKAPATLEKNNVSISGGTRITGISATSLSVHRYKDPNLNDSMDVRVNQPGDFSTYTLSLIQVDKNGNVTPLPGFDPRFSEVDFTFKAACPTGLDCLAQRICPRPAPAQPGIDYLAKDYESFRQLILDRMALTVPSWQETHEADIGVALVEILAYVADYLSYYQDAVATEAYLGTARQRISVRRHVRLIDYAMHEGCNARAWLTLQTDTDHQFDDVTGIFFITAFPGAPNTQVLNAAALRNVPMSSYEVFQSLVPATGPFPIYQAHSEIAFYTWGDSLCCLAPGSTSAALVDKWVPTHTKKHKKTAAALTDGPTETERSLQLKADDFLVFEEVLGPHTGNAADADPMHRQAVRLTKVTPTIDKLYDQPIVLIEWSIEDALTFPLCLSVQLPAPECTMLPNVTVARGNVMLVDHGASTSEILGTVPTDSTTANCPSPCHPALVQVSAGQFRPTLSQAPLTFSQPEPDGGCSAEEMVPQDPRQALPDLTLASIPAAPAAFAKDSSSLPPLFTFDDLKDPTSLALRLKNSTDIVMRYLNGQLSAATRELIAAWKGALPLPANIGAALKTDLNALVQNWSPVADLLESGPNDFSFVVEMDDDGIGHLRFGDGRLGRQPDAGMTFRANYRIGNGTPGNVGAESIQYLVLRDETLNGQVIQPRNPLPAVDGTQPEPVSEIKLFAPHAFQDTIERAITAADYATLTADNARRQEERPARAICAAPFVPLQGAKATLRWTGAWYEALVAIDPLNTEQAPPELLSEIHTYLNTYRRMGQDVTVVGANYVPLDLALSVCVLPDFLRAHVEQGLLQVFGTGVQPNGVNGFFNPNNLTFGEGIYVSRIIAAAQAVTGVESVSVIRLQRYRINAHPYPAISGIASGAVPPFGVLPFGPFEVAQLDNDPNFPERGFLELKLRGGR